MYGLNVQNAQEMHVSFEQSVNVQAVNIVVTSSGTSPNTDGIHVALSENVQIISPIIKAGKPKKKKQNLKKKKEKRKIKIVELWGILIFHGS